MTVIGDAYIEIKPDAKGFADEAERDVGGALKGIASKAALAAGAFAVVGGGVFLKGAVEAASDLSESMSKINVVFGDSADSVVKFTETAASSLGQTQAQAAEAVGTFGNLLRAVGLTDVQAADFSTSMVQLAGDLASFNNADPTEVLDALRAGLTGEAEPLKRFGVNINAARIEAKALELGLVGVDGVMSDAAKTQATYALIMEDTKLAQGDFARTSGGLANQQRILAARFGDLQAKIGAAFLPIVTKVVSFLAGPGIAAFEGLTDWIGRAASFLASALGPAFAAVGDVARDVVDKVVEFVNALRTGFTEDEGTGIELFALRLRDTLVTVFDFLTGTVLPGLRQALDSLISGFQGTGGEGSFFVDLGEAARGLWDVIQRTIPPIVGFFQDSLLPAISELFDSIRSNRPLLIGLGVAFGLLVAPVATLVGGFILAYQRSEAFREAVATVVDTVVALAGVIADVLSPVVQFIGEQIGELVTFFVDNFDQMREAVTNVVTAIAVVIGVVLAPIVIFFRSWGDEILEIITVVWEQIRNTITTAIDLIKGIITVVMALLTGEWGQAWDAILGIVSTTWSYIAETIENALQIVLQLVQGIVGGVIDVWRTGWQTVFNVVDSVAGSILGRVSSFVGEVVGYFLSIPGQLLGMVASMASAAASLGGALIDGFKGALSGAVGFAGDIARAIKNAINNTVLRPLRNALTFTLDLPGPFGSFTVNGGSLIPLLAKGGITTGPTLAGIGEAGREGVFPLPPGLLEGLVALARDRLAGTSPAGGLDYHPTLVFPAVTNRDEADAVTERVNANLFAAAQTRAAAVAVRS